MPAEESCGVAVVGARCFPSTVADVALMRVDFISKSIGQPIEARVEQQTDCFPIVRRVAVSVRVRMFGSIHCTERHYILSKLWFLFNEHTKLCANKMPFNARSLFVYLCTIFLVILAPRTLLYAMYCECYWIG